MPAWPSNAQASLWPNLWTKVRLPACCAARITQGSSGLARIMARLPGGGPTRTSVTTDNSDAETVRGSLDIRSNPRFAETGVATRLQGSACPKSLCIPHLNGALGDIDASFRRFKCDTLSLISLNKALQDCTIWHDGMQAGQGIWVGQRPCSGTVFARPGHCHDRGCRARAEALWRDPA